MATLMEQLRSGKFCIYAQWSGLLSIILLLAFGIGNLVNSGIWSALYSIVLGIVFMFFEIPFCVRCCNTGPRFVSCIKFFENHFLRSILYIGTAVVGFIFPNSIVAPFVFLCITGVLYGLAGFKKEEHENVVAGGIATAAVGAAVNTTQAQPAKV